MSVCIPSTFLPELAAEGPPLARKGGGFFFIGGTMTMRKFERLLAGIEDEWTERFWLSVMTMVSEPLLSGKLPAPTDPVVLAVGAKDLGDDGVDAVVRSVPDAVVSTLAGIAIRVMESDGPQSIRGLSKGKRAELAFAHAIDSMFQPGGGAEEYFRHSLGVPLLATVVLVPIKAAEVSEESGDEGVHNYDSSVQRPSIDTDDGVMFALRWGSRGYTVVAVKRGDQYEIQRFSFDRTYTGPLVGSFVNHPDSPIVQNIH